MIDMDKVRECAEGVAMAFTADQYESTIAFMANVAREPAEYWDAVRAELVRLEAEPKPAFWSFYSTGEAYDACQCDARIKSGDMLVIERERVVGMAWAWPVAITAQAGKLHQAKGPDVITAADGMGATREQLEAAWAECITRGWRIAAELKPW